MIGSADARLVGGPHDGANCRGRQLTENATIVFPADRTDVDVEDPDTAATSADLNINDAILGIDAGKAPVVHPLRAWDDDDDDEECVILEAPEGAASLAIARGKAKKTSTWKRGSTASGASGAPLVKRTKVSGKKLPRRDQPFVPKAPLTSTGPALTINLSAPGRTREEAPQTPQVTIAIPPPLRATEHPSASPSRPASPPSDQFPLSSVDIPVPQFRPLVPEASYGTREETMTPTSQDSHGGTSEPIVDKPISPRPTAPDAAKGPVRTATSSATAAADNQDLAQVAELIERIQSIQGEKEKVEAELSQLRDQNLAELKVEKDEVARLKGEIDHLNQQHEIEISGMTNSFKEELSKVKEEMEIEKASAVKATTAKLEKEITRLTTIDTSQCRINELQKEQIDLLNGKMKDWATLAGTLNEEMEAAFPHSKKGVIKAVKESRKNIFVPLGPVMSNMEDYIVAMASRVSHMKILGKDVLNAALKAFDAMYPEETRPQGLPELCEWLNAADIQLVEWLHSAARAGSDQALEFVLSWYEELDLDALETLRKGSSALSDENKVQKSKARAYEIA
ncbi:hypothetical protein QYE76_035926 [Lolium multiflorum]|uniref:Uncharacterized protein n=1 Tax=Lolium multiflorum TaxID=4521 RepID=A0AAD8R3Z0_LOLMU|nr:hypothetical protein QYE76_035926 [Lolium multiflorum]